MAEDPNSDSNSNSIPIPTPVPKGNPWLPIFSVTYRQFSRYHYNKIKHMFPRMRESEIVSKIIKKWDAKSQEKKEELVKFYCNEGILQYPGLKSAIDMYFNSKRVTPYFRRLVSQIDFGEEEEQVEEENQVYEIQKPGPGVEIQLPKSLTRDYISEENKSDDSDFERPQKDFVIELEDEKQSQEQEKISTPKHLTFKKTRKTKKIHKQRERLEAIEKKINLEKNKEKVNDLIKQLKQIDENIQVLGFEDNPISYEEPIDENVMQVLKKKPQLLDEEKSEELKEEILDASKENILNRYLAMVEKDKPHWSKPQQFMFAQLLTKKKLLEDEKRIKELDKSIKREKRRECNRIKFQSKEKKRVKTLCGKMIQKKNLNSHQKKCQECFVFTKENSDDPEPSMTCEKKHFKSSKDKLTTNCVCGEPLVLKEKGSRNLIDSRRKGWITRRNKAAGKKHNLQMARYVKKERANIAKNYS